MNYGNGHDMGEEMFSCFGNYGLFGIFIHIILFIIFIYGIYILINRFSNSLNNSSAINILEENFANGKIDKKDFEEKKKILLKNK